MVFTEILADLEIEKKEKEKCIQSGVHYSKMLPTESVPQIPIDTFKALIGDTKLMTQLAYDVGVLAEKIYKKQYRTGQSQFTLVSLARAGTPIGILLKRYYEQVCGLNVPHYSVSILRDRGIDFNALAYIIHQEGHDTIQFVDGWTGKGVIQATLNKSVMEFNQLFSTHLDPKISCLYDPALITPLCATHEDRLLPSAIYNSTVSGLMSRTIQRDDLLTAYDFHGAKFYKHLADYDVSNLFIDGVTNYLKPVKNFPALTEALNGTGWREVVEIAKIFGCQSIFNVKPSVGETTRVLIRRYPERVLVKDVKDPDISFIIKLAEQQDVPVQEYPPLSHYKAVGLIKEL